MPFAAANIVNNEDEGKTGVNKSRKFAFGSVSRRLFWARSIELIEEFIQKREKRCNVDRIPNSETTSFFDNDELAGAFTR